MQARLVIKQFGPIREANIRPGNLTVFVGPQATGKSLVMQLLYFLRQMEDLGIFSLQNTETTDFPAEPLQLVQTALEWWLGTPLATYANKGTHVYWYPDEAVETTIQELWWDETGMRINAAFEQRIQRFLAPGWKVPTGDG